MSEYNPYLAPPGFGSPAQEPRVSLSTILLVGGALFLGIAILLHVRSRNMPPTRGEMAQSVQMAGAAGGSECFTYCNRVSGSGVPSDPTAGAMPSPQAAYRAPSGQYAYDPFASSSYPPPQPFPPQVLVVQTPQHLGMLDDFRRGMALTDYQTMQGYMQNVPGGLLPPGSPMQPSPLPLNSQQFTNYLAQRAGFAGGLPGMF